jgi:large subunit ribosomal protein L34e
MPKPSERSRKRRRVQVKVPGGRTAKRQVARKPAKAKCRCGKELHGVPRESATKMANMPKTAKRPERPYGGALCSKCMRAKVLASVQ